MCCSKSLIIDPNPLTQRFSQRRNEHNDPSAAVAAVDYTQGITGRSHACSGQKPIFPRVRPLFRRCKFLAFHQHFHVTDRGARCIAMWPCSKATFFSYTENSLEVSIIADTQTVSQDFAVCSCRGLVICPDPFRALQVDSDTAYGIDNSAQRINEISAPLAKAGVSIFYLSTYQTDYVFVSVLASPLLCALSFG